MILFFAVIVAIAVSVYIFNYLFPLHADDWAYSFKEVLVDKGNPSSHERIGGFKDILESQYNHYFNWGGRTIVHIIAQFLLWIGTPYNDILNTLVYVLLICLIYFICNKGRAINVMVLVFGSTLVWFFTPRFTPDILWITGSANYMWGTFIVLLFLYPYISYVFEDKANDNFLKSVLFFICGIIAGWINETISTTAVLLVIIFIIYYKKYRTLPRWSILGLAGLCIGCTIMLLAPGNQMRAELVFAQHPYLAEMTLFETFSSRLLEMLSYKYLYYMLPPSILFLCMLLIYLKLGKRQEEKYRSKILFISILFLLAGQFSFFIMIVSPVFPLWAMFGTVLFIIMGIIILYANTEFKYPVLSYLNVLLIVMLIGLYSIDYYRKYPSLKLISDIYKEREKSLEEQKSKGIEDIIFTKKIVVHSKFEYQDLHPDSWMWINNKYAFYYNVRTVRVISKSNN